MGLETPFRPPYLHQVAGVGVVLLAALACRFSEVAPQSSIQSSETAPVIANTATLAPPTLTATPQGCPIDSGPADLPPLQLPSDMASDLVSYFDQGGDPVELQAHLVGIGRSVSGEQGMVITDLTNDGRQEIALVLLTDGGLPTTPPGMLMVFTCNRDGFTLAYSSPAPLDRGAPLIYFLGDMNGDTVDDLVLKRELCGAHTCTAELHVLSWQGNTLTDVLNGTTDELPSPQIEISTPGPAGDRTIAVTATGINSVGAGPFRKVTDTWAWDSDQSLFRLVSEVEAPPAFRVHMLHEADDTVRSGDLERSLDLYQRVEQDPSLESWMDAQREQQILGAYARFRRIVVNTRLGRSRDASDLFRDSLIVYGNIPESAPFVELSRSYWDAFQASSSTLDACLAARSFASAHAPQVLDTLYFGYANRSYTSDEVCFETG